MWPDKRWKDCSWHERGFMLSVYACGIAAMVLALLMLDAFRIPHGFN